MDFRCNEKMYASKPIDCGIKMKIFKGIQSVHKRSDGKSLDKNEIYKTVYECANYT